MAEMLHSMIEIAKTAGKITLGYYDKGKEYKISQKNNDPKLLLTTADIESEKYIIRELKKHFPRCHIVSEEQLNDTIDFTREVLIVDPLDGTRQFVDHKDTYSIIIGFCAAGRATCGVLYLPVLDELFYAEKGGGAFHESKGKRNRMHVSTQSSLERATVFQKEPHHEGKQSDLLASLPSRKLEFDSATGYKICKLANGDADIFINTSQRTSKWDVCGPQAILEEAGGKITQFDGSDMNYTLPAGTLNPEFLQQIGSCTKRFSKQSMPALNNAAEKRDDISAFTTCYPAVKGNPYYIVITDHFVCFCV